MATPDSVFEAVKTTVGDGQNPMPAGLWCEAY
jgi:hypothetical protein